MWCRLVFCVLVFAQWRDARAQWPDVREQSEDREAREVKTTSGPVRGYRDAESGLFLFYGIPYATAPTGRDRFKAPLPAPIWLQPLEAVDNNIVCPQGQFPLFKWDKTTRENCLIANIYAPDTEDKKLPVVVYVHGGAYQMGYGDAASPINLVKSKKIIAVTFNYRVGIHGFLCLGTEDAPGNAGMKDQVHLLRWVRRNIANFGGNPDDVTIAGYSAGSSAVDLLMLSKTTRGLFNKVIPESGANVGVWSIQSDPLENAKNHAKKLNFTNVDDVYALGEFYTTASYELLTSDLFFYNPDSTFGFSPCVERETGVEMFLEDHPVNILKQGKYYKAPLLYGFANMEGLFRVNFGYQQFIEKINEKFSDFLPADLQFDSEDQKEEVATKVREFYFGDKVIGDDTIEGYINFFTDVIFAYPTLRAVKLHVEAGHDKIYLYEYSHVPEDVNKFLPPTLKVRGADHCAQTAAVMDGLGLMIRDESNLSEGYKKVKALMRELWTNFITTSTPVPLGSKLPAWPPVGKDRSPHMSLDSTMELRGPLLPDRTRLWDQIYDRHYRVPVPPPTPPPRPHTEL